MPTQMPFPGGWIPPDELEIDLPDGRRIVVPGRTREQQAIQEAFEGSLAQFRSYGTFLADTPDRVILHELEIKATGGLCLRPHQMTGSCVGVAGARSYCHAMCGDLIHRGDMERVELPFPFATYGWGRSYWTNRKGDGSYGGAQSRAVQEFGMLPRDSQFVPEPARVQGGWISWTSGQEYTWSHPDYWPASKGEVSDEAANYRIETVTRCRDTEEVVQLLAQGYGVTQASNWGTRACRVDGDVLMGPHNGSWAHQMSVSGYWRHPSHGLIFLIDNQWNDYHGTCPTLRTIQDPITGLYPNGSFWITEESMEYMLKSEVYGHSNTMGFPQRDIWNNMGL